MIRISKKMLFETKYAKICIKKTYTNFIIKQYEKTKLLKAEKKPYIQNWQ